MTLTLDGLPQAQEQPQISIGEQPIANARPSNLSQPTQFMTGVQQVPNPAGDPWSVGFDSVDHNPFAPQAGLYKG